MSENQTTSRRKLLQGACGAALAFPTIIPSRALGRDGATAPSNRINLAAIGMGFAWPMFLREDVQYVGVCDVQRSRREAAKAQVEEKQGKGSCVAVNDFRVLIARPDVDAVYIATPDHWHAAMTVAAARAGKHLYCQKPLTRTLAEGRAVVEAVKRHGVVFQHGTQQRHDERMLFGCELVRNGYIGDLKHVKLGSPSGATCPPQAPQPVPKGLDWNMWLGPAPWAPFTPLRIASHPWYHISDYSMGYIAGWGVHHCDSAMQGSGLDDYTGPVEIDAKGQFPTEGLFDNPHRWQMHYRFKGGPTWHWTDCSGDGFGSRVESGDWPQHRMGVEFEGTEGKVFIWRNQVEAEPRRLLQVRIGAGDKVRLRENLPPDFIECIRQGRRTCAPVEVAHRSTTLCSIAAIGMQVRRKLTWDGQREEFIGDEEANRLRSRHTRSPWTV